MAAIGLSVILVIVGAGYFLRARWEANQHDLGQTGGIRIIALSALEYAGDHNGHLPTLTNRSLLEQQLTPYLTKYLAAHVGSLLLVPGTDIPYLGNPALSGRKINPLSAKEEYILFYPARPYSDGFYVRSRPGGRYVVVLDGGFAHIAFMPEARWQQMTVGGRMLKSPDSGPRAFLQRTW